jgi:hypothetical protein
MFGMSGLVHGKLDFKDPSWKVIQSFYLWGAYSSADMCMQIPKMKAYFQ